MKIVQQCLFLILWLPVFCQAAQAVTRHTVIDDQGNQVAFSAPPQRVISLAPNLTELVFAAGMGGHLVAVSAYSDYPRQARLLKQIGDAYRLDWEKLIAFRPDLLLAWGSGLSAQDRAKLEKLKLKVLILEPRSLKDIPRILRLLGRISGNRVQADASATVFERELRDLRMKYAERDPVRVYFQIAAYPMLTVNEDHIISDVLRLCGGENVFGALFQLTPVISSEALIKENPEMLLAAVSTHEQEEAVEGMWRGLPLQAARQGRMAFITADLISRSAPRILWGARQVCEQIESARH
uniref:Substrate-binding periplasmic (PBP) ABC transporter protein n=1 Tax=Candidatus Nitrotoga fabula TaxID=2182327 RepID=A0A2X0QVA2_9PROT|nr:Substrate-binding periplasmic (PBP) ABC transporter protein [Candidatus Nitrotoga fabula]